MLEILNFLFVTHWPLSLVMFLGLAAVYLLLPRPRRYPPLWGAACAGLAILLGGAILMRSQPGSVENFLFYTFSGIAVVSGVLLVTQQNPVRAALSFALVVLSTCGLFLLQAAPFLMAATVIVYAGAIVVTFLFVIMLAQQAGLSDADQRSREPLLACIAGFVLLGALLYVLDKNYDPHRAVLQPLQERIHRAVRQETMADLEKELDKESDDKKNFIDDFQDGLMRMKIPPRDLEAVTDKLRNIQLQWDEWKKNNDVKAARQALSELEAETRLLLREKSGSLEPGEQRPLSTFSVYAADQPFTRQPRDEQLRVKMKAENTAHLGLTLFSDYLLAVELAGVLLLVAAVGAIAISSRRREELP